MFVAFFRVGGLRKEVQEDLFDRFLKGATSENASECGRLALKLGFGLNDPRENGNNGQDQ
jgi:hypothetical protein